MKKQVFNPFLPLDAYIPDGEPHVFNDRVYLFGSHDREAGETFCMLDYEIFSAPVDDLTSWSSNGMNYSAKQDPLYSEQIFCMYAPDCVRGRDGRYYLYYCLAGFQGKGCYANPISVAVCDTPDGRYEFYGHVRNKDGTPYLDKLCFDPGVINDDGVIRIYFGADLEWFNYIPFEPVRRRIISEMAGRPFEEIPQGFWGAYHAVLEDDMLTVAEEPVRIDTCISGEEYKEHRFFEASSIRKIGNTYYFIYSSMKNHELCYATSDKPDRNFIYGGTIISNGDVGYEGRKENDRLNHTGTNHGSIECINGQWYVFYHRLTHNSEYSRQACAEKIEILPDGRIPQVEMTSCGLNEGSLAEGRYPAVICCNLTNGRMCHGNNRQQPMNQPCISNNGNERFIKDIEDGTVITYKYIFFGGDTCVNVVTKGGEGCYEVMVDGQPSGEIVIQESENWKEYGTMLKDIEEGTHALSFRYKGDKKTCLKEFEIRQAGNNRGEKDYE